MQVNDTLCIVRVIVITGPPGAGKSTLATEIHDALGDAGVANALVELDELERAYPPLPCERVFGHLAAITRSYRDAGYELLFVTATIQDAGYGDSLVRAIGQRPNEVVLLTARAATLEQRIRAREPATWSGLEALVQEALRLADQMPGVVRADLELDTDAHDPPSCARLVRSLIAQRRESA
jgi:broad-specificity NMP kinase